MIDREEVRRAVERMEAVLRDERATLAKLASCNDPWLRERTARAKVFQETLGLVCAAARAYADQKPASDEWIDSWDAAAPDVQWSDQHAYHAGFAAGVAIAEWHHGIAPEIRTVPMPASWGAQAAGQAPESAGGEE